MFLSLVFVLSIPVYVTHGQAHIDMNVCNPLNATVVPPPPPELAKSYSTKVEWKWLNTNTTVDITEIYNGITDMGSQDMYIEGQEVKVIYDYKENQYITYTQRDGCVVKGLGTLAFYDNKMWLTSLKLLYTIARRADVAYAGQAWVRSTLTEKFQTCLYLFQFNITVQLDMYFSAFGWGMALSRPDEMIPVRLEMKGSVTYNNTKAGVVPFHVVGDFIEFNPKPVFEQSQMQVPAGVFCSGRSSRKPLNLLPASFSLVYEKIDLDYSKITYESIWFDSKKKLIRRDYKEASGNDPDPTTEIFDFNLGIHYSIDPYMGNCDPVSRLNFGDLFVMPNGNSTIRMMSADEFFHVKNAAVQYIGTKVSRGVTCDVWAGLYLNYEANRNFTIEWYFTQDNWIEAVGGIIQPASLFRIDIWQGGADKPIVHNVLQFNSEAPPQDVFDVGQCFEAANKTRLLVHFAVVNNGSLETVSQSYLKETLHIRLVTVAFLPPLRLCSVSIESVGKTDVYVDAILLDNAPVTNPKIVPPPPSQHTLEAAFEFLKGQIGGKLRINLNSTTLTFLDSSRTMIASVVFQAPQKGVILESKGILRIDYRQEFTTLATSTVKTRTIATPPPPEPSTQKPLIPTKYETPPTLPETTNTPCTCPTTVCSTLKPENRTISCPHTKCPDISCPPCPRLTCPTPSPINCQLSCSTRSPCPTTQKPTLCPVITKPTPCPILHCPNSTCPNPSPCPAPPECPKLTPCPKLQCPKPSPCPRVTCPTLTKPSNCQTKCPKVLPCTTLPTMQEGTADKQKGSQQNSSGVNGGAVGGIAVAMILVGIVIGMVSIIIYSRRRNLASDRKNILDKYLDNEEQY